MSVVQCDCSEIERAGSISACAKFVRVPGPLCTEQVWGNFPSPMERSNMTIDDGMVGGKDNQSRGVTWDSRR